MRTYVILLRGVMPSGKNRVPMAQLRDALSEAGFRNVRTYIQSGNVLVDTDLPAQEVERQVRAIVKERIGADLAVVARTGAQLRRALAGNPFTDGHDPARVFFVSLAQRPPAERVRQLLAADFGEEKIAISGKTAYLFIPGSAARAKLSNATIERKLGVAATTRNANTMRKLAEMSGR